MQNDELIARLEAATGPCRELDAAIAEAIGHTVKYDKDHPRDTTPYYQPVPDYSWQPVPTYSASIDAALTLVPSTMNATIDTRKPAAATLGGEWVYAPTPALAICIAALKARSHD